MTDSRSAVVLYCEVYRGLGHYVRTATLAQAFSKRFRTVLVCTGNLREDIVPPDGVELLRFPRGAHFPCVSESSVWGGKLIDILDAVKPEAVLIEYYPFGRQQSSLYTIPFLRHARVMRPRALVFSSVRDIQEQSMPDQTRFDKRVVQGVNRLMDAVLVHSDPNVMRLEDTFALAAELDKPILHTGYVAQDSRRPDAEADGEPVCLISVGGGGGGESLLRIALEAAAAGLFPEDMIVRIAAGSLIAEELWLELQQLAQGIPRLDLRRWIPNLREEMMRAEVSVSRCGYNTALDVVATGARALVVPFIESDEDEQTFRANKLREKGVVRVVEQGRLTPQLLADEVRATRAFEPRRMAVDLNGAENTVRLVERMIAETRLSRSAVASADQDAHRRAPASAKEFFELVGEINEPAEQKA